MKSNRLAILLLFILTVAFSSCSEDNAPGASNNNNGGGNNNSGCAGGPTTVTDIDGNVYNVVSIGNQCWMKENLKTTHYKNGESIPTNLDDIQWTITTSGSFADYDDDPGNSAVYGKLYNWYAVADPRGVCPNGWHVPADAEWDNLVSYLGSDTIAGGSMKEVGLAHWASPNLGATNLSGFTGLPGGCRTELGVYQSMGNYGSWWTADGILDVAVDRHLLYDQESEIRYYNDMHYGFSVRCVRD
jgi:uncharacterized protein (TIGR02145 family)